jgi:hypothetical protein
VLREAIVKDPTTTRSRSSLNVALAMRDWRPDVHVSLALGRLARAITLADQGESAWIGENEGSQHRSAWGVAGQWRRKTKPEECCGRNPLGVRPRPIEKPPPPTPVVSRHGQLKVMFLKARFGEELVWGAPEPRRFENIEDVTSWLEELQLPDSTRVRVVRSTFRFDGRRTRTSRHTLFEGTIRSGKVEGVPPELTPPEHSFVREPPGESNPRQRDVRSRSVALQAYLRGAG